MIEYYIDGSAKENMVGAGIVKINEFGFIEKRHFTIEHTNPSSQIAEGYALEKALEIISVTDIHKNEMINLYTDCRELYNCLAFDQHIEFNRSDFFLKQMANGYFKYLRDIYTDLIARKSPSCIYHCAKTGEARALIKLFFKDDAIDKKYLQEAHSLSRNYIKNEKPKVSSINSKGIKKEQPKINKIELKAIKIENSWQIMSNNKILAINKRPLVALSEALKQPAFKKKQIKLCAYLENLIKSTNRNKLSQESMILAMENIDKYKKMFVS